MQDVHADAKVIGSERIRITIGVVLDRDLASGARPSGADRAAGRRGIAGRCGLGERGVLPALVERERHEVGVDRIERGGDDLVAGIAQRRSPRGDVVAESVVGNAECGVALDGNRVPVDPTDQPV